MIDPKALPGMDSKILASMGLNPKMFEYKSADVDGTAEMDPNILKYMSIILPTSSFSSILDLN